MSISYNQFIWYGRQLLTALGLWGVVGCVLMIVTSSLIYYADTTSTASKVDVHQVSKLLPATQKKLDDNALIQTGPSINNLLAVINLLPDEQSLPTILNQMHKQAKLAQLPIASANYKWRKVKKNTVFTGKNIVQYEITFTVKGSYTAIRNMINSVLEQTPTLALDTLELKRDNSTSTQTEAKLTFLVYLIGRDE
jgi:hypothetical protein